ncbi:MAG: GDP-L-fucose synthase [Nitrospira sp.]|nr:GDP-L-fucose synthase [Nitrospira sp.]
MESGAIVYIAGHRGLIGSAVARALTRRGHRNIVTRSRQELDLTNGQAVQRFFESSRPHYVVLAAGRVGGIMENVRTPGDFLEQNLAIQLNVLRAARQTGVRKLILLGSSCMYPRMCEQPMSEEMLLAGRPEPTSLPYAVAKLAGVWLCLAYNRQDGIARFFPIIPNSTYGPHDNFDIESGHVLAALIARFHQAKQHCLSEVRLWGTGLPRREFIHADDVAEACLYLFQHDSDTLPLPLNVGVGYDVSIKDLAALVAEVVGYRGTICWDDSKPDGAPRKLLDSSKLRQLGWTPSIDLGEGIKKTYQWYREQAATQGRVGAHSTP